MAQNEFSKVKNCKGGYNVNYISMKNEERKALLSKYKALYADVLEKKLSLDLSRGKPTAEQLDLSMPMLGKSRTVADCISASGVDCRNYGVPLGVPAMRAFWSDLTGIAKERIVVGGNSSLNLMYDTVARAMLYGVYGSSRPWCREEKIKFLCPAPGYDRHFAICESLGIEMIPVKMLADGPDMDEVERLVASDAAIKGIWCVPKYANPTGVTYSDEVVRRFATMETAAPDFRIFWDNAYLVHDVYGEGDTLLNIFDEAERAGNVDRIFYFTSSSKITFPGAGVAVMAMSENNLSVVTPIWGVQTIGHDKLNQLRHLEFLPNKEAVYSLMQKHAEILRRRFDIVLGTLARDLGDTGIATWTEPRGGYFVSLDVMAGTAKRVFSLCKEAGVTLTNVGATFPYGKDPEDKNLRLAPSFPTVEELTEAMAVLTLAVRIAALEKLLAN